MGLGQISEGSEQDLKALVGPQLANRENVESPLLAVTVQTETVVRPPTG